jgi:hypothetical protein
MTHISPSMLDKLLDINPLERRFLVALFLTLLASYKMTSKSRLAYVALALIILHVAFDTLHTTYIIASVTLNLLLLKYLSLSEYILTAINFTILYVYKMYGASLDPRISGSFDISGVLMLMTIKMCYLGREFQKNRDCIRDALLYLLFIPGLVLGPVPTFDEFKKHKYEKPKKMPFTSLFRSVAFLLAFQVLRTRFPRECLFAENRSFSRRLMDLYLFCIGNRIKFYFAWHFSNCCFIFQNFPGLLNANFYRVELASDFKDLSSNWNICTNRWLKACFFEPLKSLSLFWAGVTTSSVSALWHGINPCYLIMFLSFATALPVVKTNNKLILRFCPSLFFILSRLQMLVFVNYFCAAFFLLDIDALLHVWKDVYFFGHILFFFSLGLQLFIRLFTKIEL